MDNMEVNFRGSEETEMTSETNVFLHSLGHQCLVPEPVFVREPLGTDQQQFLRIVTNNRSH